MDEKDQNKIALKVVGILVCIPIVGYLLKLIVLGIAKLIDRTRFKSKIKKGLKDGSVIEVDGNYYEVNVNNSESE